MNASKNPGASLAAYKEFLKTWPNKPHTNLINKACRVYLKAGNLFQAIELFEKMEKENIHTHLSTFWSLGEALKQHKELALFNRLIAKSRAQGIQSNNLDAIEVQMHARDPDLALQLFNANVRHSEIPNLRGYNAMAAILCQAGRYHETMELLNDWRSLGELDHRAYTTLMQCCYKGHKWELLEQTYEEMQWRDLPIDLQTFTVLMTSCLATGDLKKTEKYYSELVRKGIQPDVLFYSIMIRIWGKAGDLDKVKQFYDEMIARGMQPDPSVIQNLEFVYKTNTDYFDPSQ